MNNTFKGIIIFALGAATGAFVANKLLEQKYEEILQEDIESVRAVAKRRLAKYEGTEEEEENEECTTGSLNDISSLDIQPPKEPSRNAYNQVKSSYGLSKKPLKEVVKEIEEEDESEDDESEAYVEYVKPKKLSNDGKMSYHDRPYVIGYDAFSDEDVPHDKITLYYYVEDNTLCDENEEIIIDVDDIIGEDSLDSFDDIDDDENSIFVRNEKLHVDYEILRLNESYQQSVLGITDNLSKHDRRRKGNGEDE